MFPSKTVCFPSASSSHSKTSKMGVLRGFTDFTFPTCHSLRKNCFDLFLLTRRLDTYALISNCFSYKLLFGMRLSSCHSKTLDDKFFLKELLSLFLLLLEIRLHSNFGTKTLLIVFRNNFPRIRVWIATSWCALTFIFR